jgi:hypothetical protein
MAESQARMIAFVERMPSPPLVEQFRSMSWMTDRLADIPQRKTPIWWPVGCFSALLAPHVSI